MPRIGNNMEHHLPFTLLPLCSRSSATTTKMLFLQALLLLDGTKNKGRVSITFHLAVDYSVSLGQLAVCVPFCAWVIHDIHHEIPQGSGSTYVYGYCDATYREGWGRDETVEFVKNSKPALNLSPLYPAEFSPVALALAMSRDGSSGGTIRMCVITEGGVERIFIPGNKLPTFWEGKEVVNTVPPKKVQGEVIPVAMEI